VDIMSRSRTSVLVDITQLDCLLSDADKMIQSLGRTAQEHTGWDML
jgi:hypothetical protein